MAITFCMLLNIAIMVLVVITLGNSQTVEDTVFIGVTDAQLLYVAALLGVPLNLVLSLLLWQGSVRSRQLLERASEHPVDRTKL